jgi:hypothetical protein
MPTICNTTAALRHAITELDDCYLVLLFTAISSLTGISHRSGATTPIPPHRHFVVQSTDSNLVEKNAEGVISATHAKPRRDDQYPR